MQGFSEKSRNENRASLKYDLVKKKNHEALRLSLSHPVALIRLRLSISHPVDRIRGESGLVSRKKISRLRDVEKETEMAMDG